MKEKLLLFGLACVGGVAIVILLHVAISSPDRRESPPESVMRTRIHCACVKDHDSIGAMLRAYKDKDAMALYGLVSRGHAVLLEEGTAVKAVDEDAGVLLVDVRSGAETNQTCWIPRKFAE